MTTISLRLPDSLHGMAKNLAQQDHISINQFIASAIAEKVSALATVSYLKERAQSARADKFQQALDAVPALEPQAFDRL